MICDTRIAVTQPILKEINKLRKSLDLKKNNEVIIELLKVYNDYKKKKE